MNPNPDQQKFAKIADLLKKAKLPFDIYINVDDRLRLVAKAGSDSSSLEKFLNKGLDRVIIRDPNFKEMIRTSLTDARSDAGGIAGKLGRLNTAVAVVYLQIETMSFDEETFDHAKQVNQMTLGFLVKNPRLNEILAGLGSTESDLVKHSMMVSMFSVFVGIGMGWTSPSTLEKLALCGLLHDIGKVQLAAELKNKPKKFMTAAEKIAYDRHSEIGSQMLASVKTVPDDVRLAVSEHHEHGDGTGNRGLVDLYISPLAKVVSLSNYVVGELETIPGPHTAVKLAAVANKIAIEPKKFNKDALSAFMKIVPSVSSRDVA